MTASRKASSRSTKLDVLIETPRGSATKLKYDPTVQRFRVDRVLPEGMVFPFNFGFVPGTIGEDGDPLDVLLLMDAPVPTGCVIAARLVGVIEAEQREKDGRTVRNDRLLAVPTIPQRRHAVFDLRDIDPGVLTEVEAFFEQYDRLDGKAFRVLHRRDRRAAAIIAAAGSV
jgi:inorganic pyrophosphatase